MLPKVKHINQQQYLEIRYFIDASSSTQKLSIKPKKTGRISVRQTLPLKIP